MRFVENALEDMQDDIAGGEFLIRDAFFCAPLALVWDGVLEFGLLVLVDEPWIMTDVDN